MNRAIQLLFTALMFVASACLLWATPFDPRFVIALDELCSDGDLALSIPLMRIQLDDETSIIIRAEHVLETGDYGFVQSKIVLRPFHTTIAPYDRDALFWKKPDGSDVKLRPSDIRAKLPTILLPEKVRAAVESNRCRTYAGSGIIACVDADSFDWGIVFLNDFTFYYENGLLMSFRLPSGVNVLVKSTNGMIEELHVNNTQLLSCVSFSDREMRISASARQITVHRDSRERIINVTCENNDEIARFEYAADGLLSSATYGGSSHRYTWAETHACGHNLG